MIERGLHRLPRFPECDAAARPAMKGRPVRLDRADRMAQRQSTTIEERQE